MAIKTIEDYEASTRPAKRRSEFDRFQVEILDLLGKGYSNHQVVEALWLAHQVKLTPQALGQWHRRRKAQGALPSSPVSQPGAKQPEKITRPEQAAPASETPAITQETNAPTIGELLNAEKREERASSFIQDDDSNPFIKRTPK